MKKIIGIIHPFDLYQTFYVYEDGNKLYFTKTKINDIPETIFQLSKMYDVNKVDFSGAKHFSKGLIKGIKEKELTLYGKNNLEINSI